MLATVFTLFLPNYESLYQASNLFVDLQTAMRRVAIGQEKWDLRKCVEYALEHNITIKQQDIQAKIAELTLKQSRASQIPSLNFET